MTSCVLLNVQIRENLRVDNRETWKMKPLPVLACAIWPWVSKDKFPLILCFNGISTHPVYQKHIISTDFQTAIYKNSQNKNHLLFKLLNFSYCPRSPFAVPILIQSSDVMTTFRALMLSDASWVPVINVLFLELARFAFARDFDGTHVRTFVNWLSSQLPDVKLA